MQNLDRNVKIVNEDGSPTEFFMQLLQERGIGQQDNTDAIKTLSANRIIGNNGVVVTGTGKLIDGNIPLSADVQAILNQLVAAHGDIIFKGASGWELLPAGSSGQFLKTLGAGNDPVWAAAGGGGGAVTLLEEYTAANSPSLDFTSSISSAHDEYLVELINVLPVTADDYLGMRVSTNGGASYDSSASYDYVNYIHNQFGTSGGGVGGSGTEMQFNRNGIDNTSSYGGFSGHYRIFNPLSTTARTLIRGDTVFTSTSYLEFGMFSGAYEPTTAVNAFRIFFKSGNIASGTIRVYGL